MGKPLVTPDCLGGDPPGAKRNQPGDRCPPLRSGGGGPPARVGGGGDRKASRLTQLGPESGPAAPDHRTAVRHAAGLSAAGLSLSVAILTALPVLLAGALLLRRYYGRKPAALEAGFADA